MTSGSFTEPPGWMMAPTPARAASSTPSAKGKKASEANTAPAGSCPCWRALCTARNEASTRDIWPAPMPIAASSRTRRMAFDLTAPTAAPDSLEVPAAVPPGGSGGAPHDAEVLLLAELCERVGVDLGRHDHLHEQV